MGGSSPLLGELLPIELANTRYAVRGQRRDGLLTNDHLAVWLRECRARFRTGLCDEDLLAVTADELGVARQLREAVHDLLTAVVSVGDPPERAIATGTGTVRKPALLLGGPHSGTPPTAEMSWRTWATRHASATSRNSVRPPAGSTYWPWARSPRIPSRKRWASPLTLELPHPLRSTGVLAPPGAVAPVGSLVDARHGSSRPPVRGPFQSSKSPQL
ncbi:MAG: ABATE domain-containing protein [Actinomycetota bacterium]|nr:ABATE domain-containing protein [Actinomycetota bacterium]MDQ6945997.1 ABATE domain-containing protein [Actinomycetota bacterium]